MDCSRHKSNMKLLTVSVAAYNVEKTLRQCLNSCVVEGVMDAIEVIIVDDGSADSTASIAGEYVDRWPNTFRLIRKDNGGYGSTVNASIDAASGRYFRLLDGDDWFDEAGLIELVGILASCDADLVYTERALERGDQTLYDDISMRFNLKRTLSNPRELALLVPSMWMFTVRRTLILEHPFRLPEHCLYTDGLFTAYLVPHIRTAVYLPVVLYHYRIGYSDSQSMSVQSSRDHLADWLLVWERVRDVAVHETPANPWMVSKLAYAYINVFNSLMLQCPSHETKRMLIDMELNLKHDFPMVYDETSRRLRVLRILRRTKYMAYTVISHVVLSKS